MNKEWINLIQGNLESLFDIENRNLLNDGMSLHYLQVLKSYLRGEIETLNELCKIQTISLFPKFYQKLVQIRLDLLNFQLYNFPLPQIDEKSREDFLSSSFFYSNDHWVGEFYFVLGLFTLEVKDYENSKKIFRLAYTELDKIGAFKKSVRALLNVIVSESRLYPNKKLIIDYEFVVKKALAIQEFSVSGICYLNISRELQLIGSLTLALKYVNKAIEHLSSDIGAKNYYSALLHRCHILIELERSIEAKMDIEEVRLSPFSETQEAAKLLEIIYSQKFSNIESKLTHKEINETKLDPTWRGRFRNYISKKKNSKLSDLESTLIESLLDSNKTKNELISILYGDQIDYSASENRFRVLLSRFRKRHPGLIINEDGLYKISDDPSLTEVSMDRFKKTQIK